MGGKRTASHLLWHRAAVFDGACLVVFLAACNFPSAAGNAPVLSTTHTVTAGRVEPELRTQAAATDEGGSGFIPTMRETIVHQRIPGEPGSALYYVGDYSSKASAVYKAASGGDYYLTNLFERPFTAEAMDYLPEIDILRADIAKDGTWLYATIRLEEAPAAGAEAWYGVEVDTDLDGRGDYLIRTAAPAGMEWTTDSVQIWEDGNGDVGGTKPLRTETGWEGDGYEKLAFDGGRGADPDSAWARTAPGNPKYVQLAFLQSAVENDMAFLWSAWAEKGEGDTGGFDYNDLHTPAEAGSSMKGHAEYPLKALAEVDNTCRMSVGFDLTGSEPGACPVEQPTPTPTLTATATRTKTPTRTQNPLHIQSFTIAWTPPTISGQCPYHANLQFTITATGTGYVYWDLFYSINGGTFDFVTDGGEGFTNGGTASFYYGKIIEFTQTIRARAHITDPIGLWANEATLTATCT
ncbi:MAG: hypothetical protein JW748_09405 [Anaerolineales bacterium]|nr:hypothetical protein [Anaerolineales bacterium]